MLAYDLIAFYPWEESQPIPNENGCRCSPPWMSFMFHLQSFQLLLDRHRSHGQTDE